MLRKLFRLLGAIIRHAFAVLAALAKGLTPPAFVHADEEPPGLDEKVLAQAEEDRRRLAMDAMAEAFIRWAATPPVSRPPVSQIRAPKRFQEWAESLSESNIALLAMLSPAQVRRHLVDRQRCLNLPLLGETVERKKAQQPAPVVVTLPTRPRSPARGLRAPNNWMTATTTEPEEAPSFAPGR